MIIEWGLGPIIDFFLQVLDRGSPGSVIPPPVGGRAPPSLWSSAPPSPLSIPIAVPVTVTVAVSVAVSVTVVSFGTTARAARSLTVTTRPVRWGCAPIVTPNRRRRVLGPLHQIWSEGYAGKFTRNIPEYSSESLRSNVHAWQQKRSLRLYPTYQQE